MHFSLTFNQTEHTYHLINSYWSSKFHWTAPS